MVFKDDHDRSHFLGALAEAQRRTDWTCFAYCLMGNHYHLLLQAPEDGLRKGMHHINSSHAIRFNLRHEQTGCVFERRYQARLVEDWEHGMEAVRYIALNPVRAGLCRHAADWRWSSYRATAGLERAAAGVDADAALHWFNGDRAAFVAAVAAASGQPERPPLLDVLQDGRPERLRIARRLYGYTQAEMAEALAVSTATVSRRINQLEFRAGREITGVCNFTPGAELPRCRRDWRG